MFEQRTDSINRLFRHQQHEQLSHLLEPCEFPIRTMNWIRPFGSGVAKPQVVRQQPTDQQQHGVSENQRHPRAVATSSSRHDIVDQNWVSDGAYHDVLTREQEQSLARKIDRYQVAFQRMILKEPDVVRYLAKQLKKWNLQQLRIDVLCNLGLSEMQKRKSLEPLIRKHMKTLNRIPSQLASATTLAVRQRLHRKTIRLVEPLTIRPRVFADAPFKNPKASELITEYHKLCQQMTQCNLRLVLKVTRQICGTSPVFADMVQEGNRGLMHAITKFDHRCNVRFSTYATPWIKQAILGALPGCQRNIRVPENFRTLSRKIKRCVANLRREHGELNLDSGRSLSLIARALDMQVKDLERHFQMQRDTCSLDQPWNPAGSPSESNAQLADLIPDHRHQDPQFIVEADERDRNVQRMLDQSLSRREHDVISLRFGIGDGQSRSLAEVGIEMGLTRQRVCQLEKQALAKLEKVAQSPGLACV